MEGKYRFRKADQKCPECGKDSTIIKGKKEYGGGWICFQKKGGCGAKFKDGDPAIENQNMGRVEHDNPADYYNTVLKMAKKRAHVDAVLTATAASDIFTQDIEDMPEVINAEVVHEPSKPHEAPAKPKITRKELTFIEAATKAKQTVGEKFYYELLGTLGVEHCTELPEDQQASFLNVLREQAKLIAKKAKETDLMPEGM